MTTTFLIVLAFALFVVALVNKIAANSVRLMANPNELFDWDSEISDASFRTIGTKVNEWAESHGYTHKHNFAYQEQESSSPIKTAAWWSEQKNTWCLMYVNDGGHFIDFVTLYANDVSLTTGSTKDGYMLPNIESAYKQMFPNLEISDLHSKHIAGCSFIENHKNVKPNTYAKDLKQVLPEHISNQSKYIMSLPFWNLRGAYWFFIRRNIHTGNLASG